MASAARLSVQRLPALGVLIRQSCTLSLSSRHLPLLAQHSTKLFRRAQHQNALSSSPTDTRPSRPMNSLEILQDLITPDLYTRTIAMINIASFAVEDDLHELFAESGLKYERIIMFFTRTTGFNTSVANVIMADESTAKAAVDELDGAALFDQKLGVRTIDGEMWKEKQHGRPSFTWGWEASKVLNHDDPLLRAPDMKVPKDIFRPIREGRRVLVDFPSAVQVRLRQIYGLFHSYNVDATSWNIKYTQKVGGKERSCYQVDFSTREEADDAVRVFHEYNLNGCRLHVAKYQIPLKYLGASWDSGLPGAHFSGRDRGSAVGTNYEHLEEEILVKAILGKRDRKLWVPTHTY